MHNLHSVHINNECLKAYKRGDGPEGEQVEPECVTGDVQSVSIGCGAAQDTMEFKSHCSSTVYSCHGSWGGAGRGYVIAAAVARASSHPRALCFIYTTNTRNDTSGGTVGGTISLSMVSRTCDRGVVPGLHGDNAYNLTINGTCEQSSKYNSLSYRTTANSAILFTALVTSFIHLR